MWDTDLIHIESLAMKAIESWGLKGQYRLLSQTENVVFELITPDRSYIVRITDDRHQDRKSLLAEIDFLSRLNHSTVQFALPIANKSGEYVVSLCDSVINTKRHVVLFEKIPYPPYTETQNWNVAFAQKLGSTIKALHDFQSKIPKDAECRNRKPWSERNHWHYRTIEHPLLTDQDRSEATQVFDWAKSLEESSKTGIIHADLHHRNYMISMNQTPVLFDFDDMCFHFYEFDLCVPYFYFKLTEDSLNTKSPTLEEFQKALLEAYDDPSLSYDRIMSFVRFRASDVLLWMAERYGKHGFSPTQVAFAERLRDSEFRGIPLRN